MSTHTEPDPTDTSGPLADGPRDDVQTKPGGSRTNAAMWFAILGGVILAILLVFVLQNLDQVRIEFLGLSGEVPVGVALLLAAIAGGLIVAIAAGARILQLRRRATGWKR
ncbi:lipopolysaccharide assembly LapA domain-containing protein [Patulibacter sp.]|uniref:LapA family protein n=1 Tax=Patulibacter sp. TaxID=1912859 RepID=UPI002721A82D|nr:lipopolysaccharide assembly protein LapA domain-containing protein [Patulibacter sp.]MDO9407963.1 lipopolysaccharide assembly protein LapA domain-containing protein [Patulibacter sp.]